MARGTAYALARGGNLRVRRTAETNSNVPRKPMNNALRLKPTMAELDEVPLPHEVVEAAKNFEEAKNARSGHTGIFGHVANSKGLSNSTSNGKTVLKVKFYDFEGKSMCYTAWEDKDVRMVRLDII
jgi:hypothetical protein